MPLFDLTALLKQLAYDRHNPLLFNNGFFVIFFAAFIALYYAFRNHFKTRRYIFCLFSLYFFYKASGEFVALVIISAIVDFFLSNAIYRQQRKMARTALLVCSVVFNLGLLFYFKYTNFFISVSNDLFSTGFNPLNILLPVGISFYTFENLSYTIDVYRGQFQPVKKFTDYLLFLSFFPKLVMGPIVRAHDFIPQINKPYHISDQDFSKGFYLIISGLFKKLIISDFITLNFVNYIFDDPARYTGLENLMAVYAYAVVIYCDFSGYSDVAIGIAKWLGFTIPINFLSPYQSKTITEFWRRWHISLSSWLRDYLYIPLGGNRRSSFGTWFFSLIFFTGMFLVGKYLLMLQWWGSVIFSEGLLLLFMLPAFLSRKKQGIATNMNLLITMLLGGFWHGASWNFIIWGTIHGVGLLLHKIWTMITGKAFIKVSNRWWYNAIAIIITFHFVCFGWVYFKAADFNSASAMLYQIRYDFDLSVWPAFAANYKQVLIMMAVAYLLHTVPDTFADKMITGLGKIPLVVYLLIFFAFVLVYGYFKSADAVMPIYLQF